MSIPFHFSRMGRSFRICEGHQYKMYSCAAVMYSSTEPDDREKVYIVMPLQIARKGKLAFGNRKIKKGELYLPAFKRWAKLGHFFRDYYEAYKCYSSYGKLPSHV